MSNSTPAGAQTSATDANGNEPTAARAADLKPAAPAKTPATPAPLTEVEVTFKGRPSKLAVTPEKVREWAQKAMLVDDKTSELHRDPAQFAEFKDMQRKLHASPVLRDAVSRAFTSPEQVLSALQRQVEPAVTGDDQDDAAPARRAAPAANIAPEAQATIDDLRRRLTELEEQTATETVTKVLDREVASYPWVAGNKKAERLVKEHVLTQIRAGSRDGVAALAGEAANHVRELIAEEDQQRVARQKKSEEMQTTDPSRGGPMLTPAPKLGANSWRDGSMAAALKQRTKEFFGG